MRVFLTGATGFIGSRIVPELIGAGHSVLGLTRSDSGARRLAEAGAEAFRGDLDDAAGLARGAVGVDAVIHTAFDHDFSRFPQNCEKDRSVIRAIGEVLAGSRRPFLITSGIGMGSVGHGEPAREDVFDLDHPNPRIASELAGAEVAAKGVGVAIVRLSQIHDTRKQGLVTPLIELAKRTGVSAYLGQGDNRWPAAPIADVARLYRLALERHETGARWHAVAEERIPLRAIAETIAAGLGVPTRSLAPEEAAHHFGWLAGFAGMDMPASSALTRERLDWHPTGPGLVEDLRNMDYAS
ncbi:NAD-dependent dehydratase [Aureimonas endophytica]|uniref:NAD-dependent dehydratase n=1 Tax=Aureimonas endophytica TaxID=2027858 RepID=A0A916ZZ42_9HYPH|nr:SDR family oxidoreductase [Aureimonas endophytica]GGE19900.1 NAD-dependent dehydratase [Aureimonas endophytica]